MTIQPGDSLPSVKLMQATSEGPKEVDTATLLGSGTVVLFGVPGAFTPTCSAKHLPGFVQQAKTLKDRGVDTVACVATNDAFVMAAWGRDQGVTDELLLLADGSANFAKALGLDMDMTARGMGTRYRRFALIAKGGKVTYVGAEEPGAFEVSSAEAVLSKL